MPELALHPATKAQLQAYVTAGPHAILLTGPPGSGKASLASQLAADSLKIDSDQLQSYPYLRIIRPIDGKAIAIETIRELEHFLSLQVPSPKALNRVVIIEDSHLLSHQAQNALLKTLEEPPRATLIIMTATSESALLPTIRSRVQTTAVLQPPQGSLQKYFAEQGIPALNIEQAHALSGGLPGLMQALINDEAEHPLRAAATLARELLSKTAYERLLYVDELAKQKQLAQNICFIMQQMARISLHKTDGAAAKRWEVIMGAAYRAGEAFESSGQPKLILINLMVQLG